MSLVKTGRKYISSWWKSVCRWNENLGGLKGKHFIWHIIPKLGSKKQCVVQWCIDCNAHKRNCNRFKKKQSAYKCSEWERSLCNLDCFIRYHIMKYIVLLCQPVGIKYGIKGHNWQVMSEWQVHSYLHW